MSESINRESTPSDAELMPKNFEYRLLVGHKRTDGTYKTSDTLRAEYVHRTDELIRQMTEGVDVEDPVTHERRKEVPDHVIWLDKSARPVAWLAKEMWGEFAPAPGEEPPKRPDFHFINIDREQWVNELDPNGAGTVDVKKIDRSVIRSLRSIFVSPKNKRNGLTEDIDTAPALLDNKTVLVVDEVNASGRTLKYAELFLHEAFPTARIAAAHWMGGVASKNGAQGNADLPVWYKKDSPLGRGVMSRDPVVSQRSASTTQRLGGWFLGTRLSQPDPESDQLRNELKHLAHDPNVIRMPSFYREKGYEERAIALNGLQNFKEFVDKKRQEDAKRDAELQRLGYETKNKKSR